MDWLKQMDTLQKLSKQIEKSKEQLEKLITKAEEEAKRKDVDNDPETERLWDASTHLFDALYFINSIIGYLEERKTIKKEMIGLQDPITYPFQMKCKL